MPAHEGEKRSRWGLLDALLLLLLVAAAGWLAWRVTARLEYQWNWGAMPRFLLYRDETGLRLGYLTGGLLCTLKLSLWAAALTLPAGFILALARMSRRLYPRLLARTFIELMRNLPPLVIIFLVYYFLADQIAALPALFGFDRIDAGNPGLARILAALFAPPAQLAAFLSAVVTLALFESAYTAEILRAGIESIDRGQWEAGFALGLTRGQALRRIILPQALRRVLPPLAGQLVSLIKDSAIVSVIAIGELTWQGSQLMASTYLSFEVWLTVAALYLVLTLPCSCLADFLHKRTGKDGR